MRKQCIPGRLSQRLGIEARVETVAQNLCVDLSTVSRTVSLFNTSGNVEKKVYPPNTGTASLTETSSWKQLLRRVST